MTIHNKHAFEDAQIMARAAIEMTERWCKEAYWYDTMQALTDESARESGNILLIVAARMARRELFTPLHYVSELPQKVVGMRVLREALERSEETLQHEVCKIVDGHDWMQKKLKEAEEKLEAAEKRIAELEAIKPIGYFAYDTDGCYDRFEGEHKLKQWDKHIATLEAALAKAQEERREIVNFYNLNKGGFITDNKTYVVGEKCIK